MLHLGPANSLAELLDAARSAEATFGGQVWYRGQSNADWKLVPSAHRRHPSLETQFVQHFRLRAPTLMHGCPRHDDQVAWLPLMQHYGLPTRLLDWTESLLVAAYFSLEADKPQQDGAVWMLAPGNLNHRSFGYLIPLLSNDMAKPIVADAFGAKPKHAVPDCIAVLAPRTDNRMAAQLGNYTIHGSREPLEQMLNTSQFLAKIDIPATAHDRLRHELSIAGLRRSSLFPDLSNLARELSELKAFGPSGEDLESAVVGHLKDVRDLN